MAFESGKSVSPRKGADAKRFDSAVATALDALEVQKKVVKKSSWREMYIVKGNDDLYHVYGADSWVDQGGMLPHNKPSGEIVAKVSLDGKVTATSSAPIDATPAQLRRVEKLGVRGQAEYQRGRDNGLPHNVALRAAKRRESDGVVTHAISQNEAHDPVMNKHQMDVSEVEKYKSGHHNVNEELVAELTRRMKENGGFVGGPLLVQKLNNGTLLFDGDHRLEAAKRAGIKKVPVELYENNPAGSLAALKRLNQIERDKDADGLDPVEDAKRWDAMVKRLNKFRYGKFTASSDRAVDLLMKAYPSDSRVLRNAKGLLFSMDPKELPDEDGMVTINSSKGPLKISLSDLEEGFTPYRDRESKRAFTSEQRDRMADSGTAMSDGSFPIANREDLQNAISAIGRAKNPSAARRHIIKRAKVLNAISMLPDSWNVSE